MEEQKKFQRFEAAVFAEVDAKVEQLRSEAVKEKEDALRQSEAEQSRKAADYVQKKLREIQLEHKRSAAKYSLECQRSILQKRSELQQSVFSTVQQKLTAFTGTPAYGEYLLSQIKAFAKAHPLRDATILLREQDMDQAKALEQAYALPCQIQADNALVGLGGFVVRDDASGLYFDESFAQKLADQKSYFIENSGLSLE